MTLEKKVPERKWCWLERTISGSYHGSLALSCDTDISPEFVLVCHSLYWYLAPAHIAQIIDYIATNVVVGGAALCLQA